MTEPGPPDQTGTVTEPRSWRRIGEPDTADRPPQPHRPNRPLRRIDERVGFGDTGVHQADPPEAAAAPTPPAAVPTPPAADPAAAPTPAAVVDERRGIVVGRAVAVVAAVVAAVMVAGLVVLGLKVHSNATMASLRSSAVKAGSADGVLLSSYDYRNLTGPGTPWARLEANATPSFRQNFLSTSGTLSKLLTQYNATATGKVITAGLVSATRSRAEVALFIDQTVNNTVQKSSSTQPLRSQVLLVRSGDRWLINDLQVPR